MRQLRQPGEKRRPPQSPAWASKPGSSTSADPAEYARYGLLSTPGLVINDKLASGGRVPSVAEVTTLLTNVLAAA